MAEAALKLLLSFPPHPPNPQQTEADYNTSAKKFQELVCKYNVNSLTATIKGGEDFLEVSHGTQTSDQL